MPQPPPSSHSPEGRLNPPQGRIQQSAKAVSTFLTNTPAFRSLVQSCSCYCALMLLTLNLFLIVLVLDSAFLLSVDAAAVSPYKTYLTKSKSNDYENEETHKVDDEKKWTTTGVRFLTKVKESDTAGSKDWEDKSSNDFDLHNSITSSDFHIIELDVEEENKNNPDKSSSLESETLRIHLTRKSSVVHPHLRVVVRNEDEVQDWNLAGNQTTGKRSDVSCHFVGHVSGTPALSPLNPEKTGEKDDKETGRKSSGGVAVFSACPPSHGFSGLIIMDDGRQWYLEPSESGSKEQHGRKRREASSFNEFEVLEHVLLPHSQLAGHLAAHISDVLRVPLPELEEAARLAAVDAQARRNVRQATVVGGATGRGWDDDEDGSFEGIQSESSILTPFFYSGASLPFFGRAGDHKVTHTRKVVSSWKKPNGGTTSSVQTTLLTPLDSGVSRDSSSTTTTTSSTTVRETAASSISSASVENLSGQTRPLPRVVEIAVFTDEELFSKMKSKFSGDTTSQMKEYATAMVNMMDVMYQHSSLGAALRFRLVYLEVMQKKPTSLKTHGGKAKAYLSSFCDYAGEKNVNSAQWDHALLLTGIDLHEEGVKTTAGLAWAGTMCFRYYSCSISEGLNFASAYITTHEIGHSLGMEHDGVGISESCDATKYIMSPTTGPGKVTWSSCSASNLQDFIKYGTSELRGKTGKGNFMISRPICLEELVSSRGKKSFELEEKSGSSSSHTGGEGILETESDMKLPGEKYDANYQCSLGMGSFFKPHFERHKPPFDNICWILYCGNGTHAISTHPALEGTPCDRKKYCRSGQCVKRPDPITF